MPSFCTFLLFRPDQTDLVKSLCHGAGWNVRFIADPSKRYRFWSNGFAELAKPEAASDFESLKNEETFGQLLILDTEEAEANNITNLIKAAGVVDEGFPYKKNQETSCFELPNDITEQKSIFENVFRTTGFFEQFSFSSNRSLATSMAASAWSKKPFIYAILKLARSYQTEAITPWSTAPIYGEMFQKHSALHSDHISTATAINLAFSAIEDLKLAIKSSKDKPRFLSGNSDWNPEVLADIETRLLDSNIDPNSKISWIFRGEKTEIEVKPLPGQSTDYFEGDKIRDINITLPYAIHACSYLRNFWTAHAFTTDTERLGPYEVFNVQNLVRTLLLSKCQLWNVSEKKLLEQYSQR